MRMINPNTIEIAVRLRCAGTFDHNGLAEMARMIDALHCSAERPQSWIEYPANGPDGESSTMRLFTIRRRSAEVHWFAWVVDERRPADGVAASLRETFRVEGVPLADGVVLRAGADGVSTLH